MANVYPIGKLPELDLTNPIAAKLAVFTVASDGVILELVSSLPLAIDTGVTVAASGEMVYDGTVDATIITELLAPLPNVSFYTSVKYNTGAVDCGMFSIALTPNFPLLTAWADTSGGELRTRIWAAAGGFGPSGGLPVGSFVNWGGKANAASSIATTLFYPIKIIHYLCHLQANK